MTAKPLGLLSTVFITLSVGGVPSAASAATPPPSTSAAAHGASTQPHKCDGTMVGNQCMQIINNKVYFDGKLDTSAVVRHSEDRASSSTTLPAPPAGVQRIAAVYDSKALAKIADMSKSSGFVLPQLYIIDLKTGQAAQASQLPKELAAFAAEHANYGVPAFKPEANAELLPSILKNIARADGSPLKREEFTSKQFAAFQLWATWCTGCMSEAKELSGILAQHPMPQLAWVAVETDMQKLDLSK